jgi:vacuolar protein sorting-associated protein VTA1
VKEGKDPNESNPKPEPAAEESLPALDPNDPEVQQFETPKPHQPSVEDVPDEQDRIEAKLARQSSIDQSLHPSAQVSARGSPAPADPRPYDPYRQNGPAQDDVSPLEPSPPNNRNGSVGGGYFPEVPTFTSETQDSTLPTAPPDDVIDLGLPDHPSTAPGFASTPDTLPQTFTPDAPPTAPPQDFYRQAPPAPPPSAPQHVNYAPPVAPVAPVAPQPQHPTYQQTPYVPPSAPVQHFAPPPTAPAVQQPPKTNAQLNTDDVAIAKAQKHARWAISALNFEDAETAVRELRAALQTLGA